MKRSAPSKRTTVQREAQLAEYDREAIYRILDEAFICHVGFIVGGPIVIPTAYARIRDHLVLHGSPASRLMSALREGADVCVTVTIVDGLVLARSAFYHSMNYRSVVVFGRARSVENRVEKIEALRRFAEHVVPGRWADVRQPSENELKATLVLRLPLAEASAKVRNGPPNDAKEDYALPVWAGEIPLRMIAGAPVADPQLASGIRTPDYALRYSRSVPPR